MLEKRATYHISLQTAIVKGEIDTDWDRRNLEKQRKLLGISKREHELLIDSFAAREKMYKLEEEVRELYLINIDGLLIANVSRFAEKEGSTTDRDIMAGMLVAIRDYVEEGLRSGTQTSLDAIKYGDYSLIIETMDSLVLAAVVRGTDNPELRQQLRDHLMILKKKYGKRLTEWDGDYDKLAGIKKVVGDFMAELQTTV
jgi:hypothetical protein